MEKRDRPDARPVRLLLSRQAASRLHAGLGSALAGAPWEVVALEDLGPGEAPPVDIGFLSRDITGTSSKTRLAPAMQRFFDALFASPGLRWVHTHSAGADRPMYAQLLARGVRVSTSSGSNAQSVALTAVGGIIALARRFPDIAEAQRRREWKPLLGERTPRDLAGQSALVVGLGPIGREIARLLRAIGVRVVGVRQREGADAACDETITYAGFASALPAADWLVLACPLTPVSRGLVDAAALGRLPPGARLVNVARGEVVVEADLVQALRDGRLAGAWLDVFEQEPLDAASPLWEMPGVVVSPHSAGFSTGQYDRVGEIFVDNLARWRAGQALRNEVAAP